MEIRTRLQWSTYRKWHPGYNAHVLDDVTLPTKDQHSAHIHRVRKKVTNNILGITSSNTGRFSKFFQYHNLLEICNKTVIKFPTTPQMRRYNTL